MLIVKNLEQYNNNNIFFCEPIINNIIDDSNFIRILYSTHEFILNGIYLYIPPNDIIIEKHYNKYKCSFNINSNNKTVDKIKQIELQLLQKYYITNKKPLYKIYSQIINGGIKIFNNYKSYNTHSAKLNEVYTIILKISGIWETDYNYGLTYKFIKL
jgi:hypothetical protein